MDIQGYFTKQGLALSAKLLSGATLEITRVAAGSGNTDKPASATALPQIQQTLAVNTPTHSGNTAMIPATLAAAQAAADYTLTELGVYAKETDGTEILYKVYKLEEPVDIVAGSRTVLRFYLEETVSQDLKMTVVCSPAGLITEEDFLPVRNTVQATGMPKKQVTLDIAGLQAYLDSLPRLLTEYLEITVSGTLTSPLTIAGFYGPGRLLIQSGSDGAVFRCKVSVDGCSAMVVFWNLQFEEPEDIGSNDGVLYAAFDDFLWLSNCTFTGREGGTAKAIRADYRCMVATDNIGISGFSCAVLSGRTAIVSVNGPASGFSGNTTGAYVFRGGMVLLSGGVDELLGGSANTKAGGFIVKENGTLA